MEMKQVESSNIESIGYNELTKEMYVKFKYSQATYVYHDVPKEKYDSMINAESAGKFLNAEIKNVHIFDKVEPDGKEKKESD